MGTSPDGRGPAGGTVEGRGPTMPASAAEGEGDAAAKRRAFEAERAAARALERKRKRLKELEVEIASGEAKLEALREALRQDHGGDWEKLAAKATEEQALARKVDAAMAEWMALGEELAAAPADAGGAPTRGAP